MKIFTLLFFITLATLFPQRRYTFSELQGLIDSNNNTHLFYRAYFDSTGYDFFYMTNDVHNWNLSTGTDSIMFYEFVDSDSIHSYFQYVNDYKFWNKNPDEFIYGGSDGDYLLHGYVQKFNRPRYHYFPSFLNSIGISQQNDSLLFNSNDGIQKSTDGGNSWFRIDSSIVFRSLSPFDDNVLFGSDFEGNLLKSTDEGYIFSIVDTNNSHWDSKQQIIYDEDSIHMYRIIKSNNKYKFLISDNAGNAFSWDLRSESPNKIYLCKDYNQSGNLFLAKQHYIYFSGNYGQTFIPYFKFDKRLVGIFKGNSTDLFAATKYDIYQVFTDTAISIKHLPASAYDLSYYPLAIGNKWIYYFQSVNYDPHEYKSGFYTLTIAGDTVLSNQKKYFIIKYSGDTTYSNYERIDSSTGIAYRYDALKNYPGDEYPIDDLTAETGDTVKTDRFHGSQEVFTYVRNEDEFRKFGLGKNRKVYQTLELNSNTYSLTNGIGLDSIYNDFDFGNFTSRLIGCVINGIVYGDTIVSVKDKIINASCNYSLFQNYPNPFNPSTNIGFRIANFGFVSLKVYDILGREVATLVNEEKKPGTYEVKFSAEGGSAYGGDGSNLSSGIYFYRIHTGKFIQTKKMIVLK